MQAILLDQFGVLHDGQKPYPGSVEAVKAMAETGRKILIISNSSRSAPFLPLYPVQETQCCPACGLLVLDAPAGSSGALGKLAKMGFPKDAFYGAITSGEVCHQALQNRPDDFYRGLGKRCVHITWGARGPISLGDLDLEVPLLAACSGGLLLQSPPGGPRYRSSLQGLWLSPQQSLQRSLYARMRDGPVLSARIEYLHER